VALAEQEDGSGDESNLKPDTLNAWQRGTGKHPTLYSVTGTFHKGTADIQSYGRH